MHLRRRAQLRKFDDQVRCDHRLQVFETRVREMHNELRHGETTACARACAPVGAIFPSPWDWMPKDTKNVLTRRFVEGAKCLDGSPAGAPRKTSRIAAIMLRCVARRALFGSGTKY